MTRWVRIRLWFNSKFRPLKTTQNEESVLVPIASIIVPEPVGRGLEEDFMVRILAKKMDAAGDVRVPLLVTAGRLLLAGNYRIQAAKRLGWTHLPCLVVPHGEFIAKDNAA
jgi:hypothetical protein